MNEKTDVASIDSNVLLEKLDELKSGYDLKANESDERIAKVVAESQSLAVMNCIILAQGLLLDKLSNEKVNRPEEARGENDGN